MKFYQHESLRVVHLLSRRHGLAEENFDPLSFGGGVKKDIDNMQYLSRTCWTHVLSAG